MAADRLIRRGIGIYVSDVTTAGTRRRRGNPPPRKLATAENRHCGNPPQPRGWGLGGRVGGRGGRPRIMTTSGANEGPHVMETSASESGPT